MTRWMVRQRWESRAKPPLAAAAQAGQDVLAGGSDVMGAVLNSISPVWTGDRITSPGKPSVAQAPVTVQG
jgi:hypothetical protein